MIRRRAWIAALGFALADCDVPDRASDARPAHLTTTGAIAIANLDHQIAQRESDPDVVELLLARSRFLGDYAALDRALAIASDRVESGADLLRRARARAAVHRFTEALADLAAAEHAGGDREEMLALRASILIAIGRAREVIPHLEARVSREADFASRSALASAYAMVGRFDEADRLYASALGDLHTTSPFPYAWIYFARGVMWAEQGADCARAEALYAQALAHLPEFVAANVHLAELEVARGDLTSAMTRLGPVVDSSDEPEALALLGVLHVQTGDFARGRREIARARERYESLLARQPLAFADHAAEFYLGPGENAERAWVLARRNLTARHTDRAVALVVRAAIATGRQPDERVAARRQCYSDRNLRSARTVSSGFVKNT